VKASKLNPSCEQKACKDVAVVDYSKTKLTQITCLEGVNMRLVSLPGVFSEASFEIGNRAPSLCQPFLGFSFGWRTANPREGGIAFVAQRYA
jgi:hypothetical protein